MANKHVNGVAIEMTAEEEVEHRASQAVTEREAKVNNWRVEMARTDRDLPRAVEDILDIEPGLAARLPDAARERLAAKKALRAARPS